MLAKIYTCIYTVRNKYFLRSHIICTIIFNFSTIMAYNSFASLSSCSHVLVKCGQVRSYYVHRCGRGIHHEGYKLLNYAILCTYMDECLCVHVYCMYMCTVHTACVQAHECVHVCVFACMHVCMFVYEHACVHTFTHAYMHACGLVQYICHGREAH